MLSRIPFIHLVENLIRLTVCNNLTIAQYICAMAYSQGLTYIMIGDKDADIEADQVFNAFLDIDHRDWINACKGGDKATCDFVNYSGALAETVLLGNVAYRAGGFDWDSTNLKTTGNAQAQSLIKEQYRPGWEI